ncbi:hypothetical protein AK812_SmicGene13203 [Symbiodinium microadriaticum]|uniref:Uncharacterized protein n=1 Tax=Symbiodinium microadriaticum TaxID=2951 RepID=A0A1Q9E8T3_SYMMI|nr:hypothetical protein AK812_SmicGene13203 [Symbiodinium microadriaticum]
MGNPPLLQAPAVEVSLVQPWRFLAGNALDVMLHVGLLATCREDGHAPLPKADNQVVLDMASTFAGAEADSGTSVVMCLFFLLLMGLGVIGAMVPWTFMDTDNLRDLTELFGFVRDTHTFVSCSQESE